MDCDHCDAQSGAARYLPARGELRLIRVCDRCGVEVAELGRMPYAPAPRLLTIHLVELTARELRLSEQRVAALRLAALTGEQPEPGSTEALVIERCASYVERSADGGAAAGTLHAGGRRARGKRTAAARKEHIEQAFARALSRHDTRLDKAAA
ncbi:MAG TPA: hypothetical protein VKU89_02295 [Solirubrobacteraceae bacterium]|nr:hypothetical protein [Solirubrobacteraceae bacterium]